eukprot:scaffold8131_cov48-Attheya_sp.AAC.3
MMSTMRVLALLVPVAVSAFSPSTMRRPFAMSPFGAPRAHVPASRNGDIVILCMANGKVGIFFGTSTGSTEQAAYLIEEEFGADADGPFEIDGIQGSVAAEFAKYDSLVRCFYLLLSEQTFIDDHPIFRHRAPEPVLGTPTWNTGADTERSGTGWDEIYYGEMQDLNIAGKKVAVFGLGDSVSYTENYADASGELHDVCESLGAKMMGYTSQDGYEHEASKAIRGDKFCGLLLDAVNQEELSEDRVKAWVAQLRSDGFLDGTDGSATTDPVIVAAPTSVAPVSKIEDAPTNIHKELENNSRLLDQNIAVHSSDSSGFVPHKNLKTGKTMWTSPDGRSCYYTLDAPNAVASFSP